MCWAFEDDLDEVSLSKRRAVIYRPAAVAVAVLIKLEFTQQVAGGCGT